MNLLFLSYWSINDPLTIATVLPHVKILTKSTSVKNVILCTIEREFKDTVTYQLDGVENVSLMSGTTIRSKFLDFFRIPSKLHTMAMSKSIDKVICRGALAGSLGYLAFKKTDIPFYVESYEPHAEYMLDTGVWRRWSLQYQLQSRWQTMQLKAASGIMTVSSNYTKQLVQQGIEIRKIRTVPCAVDFDQFRFNKRQREQKRRYLGFDEKQVVGIYVGKFGGLYYNKEGFKFFRILFSVIKDLRIILLTPTNRKYVEKKLKDYSIDPSFFLIANVSHAQVAEYLSAADFSICLHRSHKHSGGFSPVKNAEYWANGLPILLPENIGDDSSIAVKEEAGAVFDMDNTKSKQLAIERVTSIINTEGHRNRIQQVATKHRPFSKVVEAYKFFDLL